MPLPTSPIEGSRKLTDFFIGNINRDFRDDPNLWFIQRLIPQAEYLLPSLYSSPLFRERYICVGFSEFLLFIIVI